MESIKVTPIPTAPLSLLGEGPHWDNETQSLYYVDIFGVNESILRYDFAENKTYSATIDNEPVVSFIIPVEGKLNQFAVGLMRRIGIIEWDGKSSKASLLQIALEVGNNNEKLVNHRFNDGKADPTGRIYSGTMLREQCGDVFHVTDGTLYKYAKGEQVKSLIGNIGISNGLAWNEKNQKFYYIDSSAVNIREYDWASDTGDISNERVLINFRDGDGNERPAAIPDGMTIDTDGNLYVALFGGSKVVKVNANTGKIELEIQLPAEQITSVAFGGPNLDILFVTSAGWDIYKKQSPLGGSLFTITGLGVKGLPATKARL